MGPKPVLIYNFLSPFSVTMKQFLVFQLPAVTTGLSRSMASPSRRWGWKCYQSAPWQSNLFLQLCSIVVNTWTAVGHGTLTFPDTSTLVVAPRVRDVLDLLPFAVWGGALCWLTGGDAGTGMLWEIGVSLLEMSQEAWRKSCGVGAVSSHLSHLNHRSLQGPNNVMPAAL